VNEAGATVPELAILIGLQASGKSAFYQQALSSTHVHVSKDNYTNPSPEEWRPLIEAARRHGARVVGYWFVPDVPGSLERNAARTGKARVPDVGLYTTLKRLRRPRRSDGFDELYVVRFDGKGGFDVQPLAE
jgi:hypothetical protein